MQASNEGNRTIICKWILVLLIIFSGITAQWNSMELFQTGEIAERMKFLQRFSGIAADGNLWNLLFVVMGIEVSDRIVQKKKLKNAALDLLGSWWPLTAFTIVIGIFLGLMGCMKLTIADDILGFFFLNNVGLTISPNANSLLWFTASAVLASFAAAVLNLSVPEKKCWMLGLACVIAGYIALVQTGKGAISGTYQNIGVIFNLGWLRAFCGIETGVLLTWLKEKLLNRNFHKSYRKQIIVIVAALGIYLLLESVGCVRGIANEMAVILLWAVLLEGVLLLDAGKNAKREMSRIADVILVFHPLVLGVYKTWIWTYRYNFVLRHPRLNLFVLCALILICGVTVFYLVVHPAEKYMESYIEEEQKKGECYDTI